MKKLFLMLFIPFVFLFGVTMEEIEVEGTEESASFNFLYENGVDVPGIITMAGKCYNEGNNNLVIRDYLVQAFNTNPKEISEAELPSYIATEVSKRKDFLAFFAHYCMRVDGFNKMDEEMFAAHQAATSAGDTQSVTDLENSLITILADALVSESISVDGPFKIKE